MKTINLLFFLLMFMTCNCFSQEVWAPVGSVWHYGVLESPGNGLNEGYFNYESIKDTLIQGKVCSVIKKTNMESTGAIQELGFEYMYAENGVVQQLIKNKFYPLYDFNAQIGDTWITHLPADTKGYQYPEDSLIRIHVDSIKFMSNSGILLKQMYVSSQSSSHGSIDWTFKNPIIEKIGANYMFLGEWGLWDMDIPYLRCYHDNEITYQTNNSKGCDSIINSLKPVRTKSFNVFPNPSTGSIKLQVNNFDGFPNVINIYNVVGECVLKQSIVNKPGNDILLDISKLKSGIYFVTLDLMKQQTIKLTKL